MPGLSTTTQIPQWHMWDKFPGPLLSDGVQTATSDRAVITCTASATPHTLGSWALVDASLSADCDAIQIWLTVTTNTNNTNTATILEIGTGAGGAEVTWAKVLVGNRLVTSNGAEASCMFLPGFLAAGTRVSVRCQSVVVSKVVTAVYNFLPATKHRRHSSTPDSTGFVTASSQGTSLSTAAVDTKAAWTAIVASTAIEYNTLHVSTDLAGDAAGANGGCLLDIGIGGAGAESVLIPDVYIEQTIAEALRNVSPVAYGINVPAGSRLSARFSRESTNMALGVSLVGA